MKKGKRNYEELSTEVKNLSLNTPSPAAKTIKRQKKSIKPAQPPVIKEIEDIDLFKSLSQKKPQISDIISILENDVKEHHDIIIRHFLLLFLETFGLKDIANIYSEANVLHLDPKEMMEKIYGFFEITETDFVMPIFQKKGNLLQNINNFFKTMFLDSDKLIYKTRILLTLFSWIQTLSFCKIRIIRQGVLEYLHILMKVSLELYEKTHQDYLRLKGIETNEEKLKSYENRVEFLDKFLDNLFQEVLLSREKDIRPEIRTKFLEILEFLIMKSPQKFLNQQSLNTLDEMLFRKEELENIKSTCISIFCKLYDPEIEKMKAYDNFLCDFLSENQFKERIISIIIANKYKMSAQVFELALKITKKFPDDFSFDENMTKITKLAFHGGKDLRKKIAPWILQRKFEDENVGNEEPVKKIKRLMKFLHELDENNENVEEFDLKYTGFIEEAYEFLVENCKAEDIFKLIRDKAFLTQTLTYQLSSFVFIRIFLEKIKNNINNSEKNKVFYEDFSVLMIKHLEQLLNKYKHDLKLFLQLLKMLSILDENTFKATESLDPMKNLTKTLGTSLVFIKNKDFFEEICTLITTFSKFSTHLKEIAEELINKIVKEETETFQGGYIQLYKNYLEVGLLTNKTELYDQITISLQRIILLLKYFQIPSLLEEEFLVQIKEAFDKHMENKSKEDFGIAELYLGILALAHYWLLRDLFQVIYIIYKIYNAYINVINYLYIFNYKKINIS